MHRFEFAPPASSRLVAPRPIRLSSLPLRFALLFAAMWCDGLGARSPVDRCCRRRDQLRDDKIDWHRAADADGKVDRWHDARSDECSASRSDEVSDARSDTLSDMPPDARSDANSDDGAVSRSDEWSHRSASTGSTSAAYDDAALRSSDPSPDTVAVGGGLGCLFRCADEAATSIASRDVGDDGVSALTLHPGRSLPFAGASSAAASSTPSPSGASSLFAASLPSAPSLIASSAFVSPFRPPSCFFAPAPSLLPPPPPPALSMVVPASAPPRVALGSSRVPVFGGAFASLSPAWRGVQSFADSVAGSALADCVRVAPVLAVAERLASSASPSLPVAFSLRTPLWLGAPPVSAAATLRGGDARTAQEGSRRRASWPADGGGTLQLGETLKVTHCAADATRG